MCTLSPKGLDPMQLVDSVIVTFRGAQEAKRHDVISEMMRLITVSLSVHLICWLSECSLDQLVV
jgi:hypothetical protein